MPDYSCKKESLLKLNRDKLVTIPFDQHVSFCFRNFKKFILHLINERSQDLNLIVLRELLKLYFRVWIRLRMVKC